MKLRLRGNSVRLRLTQREVRDVLERGRVEDRTGFGEATLSYALEVAPVAALEASFERGTVLVRVPKAEAHAWVTDAERVSLEREQPIGGGERLRVLVEKDFQCLKTRSGEDESDAFPNPHEHC